MWMKALAVIGALAVAAAVSAGSTVVVWWLVGDAPWEDAQEAESSESPREPTDRTSGIRCQEALELKNDILDDIREAIRTGVRNPDAAERFYQGQLDQVAADIQRYC